MAQLVQYQQFNLSDFQTQAGVDKLNKFLSDVTAQLQAQQGTTGVIQPDNDIDLQGRYKIINAAS